MESLYTSFIPVLKVWCTTDNNSKPWQVESCTKPDMYFVHTLILIDMTLNLINLENKNIIF